MPPRKTEKYTYCPRLWDEIFIDERGDVFACCCSSALPFGNIYREPLSVIINSPSARRQRLQSLRGTLKCYGPCHLLNKVSPPPRPEARPLTAVYDGLRRLKLRFGERCNIRCVMCVQDHGRGEALDMAVLKRHLDLAPFGSVEMEGGEPLFIAPAREFFDYAVSAGKKVSFLSNGTLINNAWARKIARHSRFIYISLNAATKRMHELVNAGSSWEKVLANVRRLRRYRAALKGGVVIKGHMTLVRENLEEAPLFIKRFKTFGFDRICFCHSESAVKRLHESPRDMLELKNGIAAAYAASPHKRDIDLAGLLPLFKAALQLGRPAVKNK